MSILGIVAARAQSLLNLFQLVADFIESLGEIGFRHDGVFAETAPDVIGVALHVALHVRLLDAAEGFAHFDGGGAFGGLKVAGGGLHAGAELLEVGYFSVLLGSQLGGLLAGEILALRAEGATHLAFKILLFFCQVVGLAGEIFDLILGLTGADAGERLGGLIEAIGRAAGVGLGLGRAGLLGGRGVAHILESLLKIGEGVLEALLIGAAEARLSELSLLIHLAALRLLALLAGLLTALLAALLTRLARLAGLPRLP